MTRSYDLKEFKIRKKKEHKKVRNLILYEPVNQIKNYLKNLKSTDKTLFIGTNDHTRILVKLFKKILKNRSIDYYEINKYRILQKRKN